MVNTETIHSRNEKLHFFNGKEVISNIETFVKYYKKDDNVKVNGTVKNFV
jgi:transcriptional regulatory protein LevR